MMRSFRHSSPVIISAGLNPFSTGRAGCECQHRIEELQKVTLADVQRVSAERIDPAALSIVIVGDRAVIEPGLRSLEIPIVHLDYEGQPLE